MVIIILALIAVLAAALAFVWRRPQKNAVPPTGEAEPVSDAEAAEPQSVEPEQPAEVEAEPQSAEPEQPAEEEAPIAAKEVENVDLQVDELAMRLHHLMEEQQYYLKPDAGLEDFAKELGTNRTYVTQMMRQEYGLTFNEYVNVARIQHSQGILYSSPSMPMEDVAMRSGFQSTSNYCRAFKRYTGTSPINWLKLSNPNVGQKRM